jgi:hypothetical protein
MKVFYNYFSTSYLVKDPLQSSVIIVLFGITGLEVFSNLWTGVIVGTIFTCLLREGDSR